MFGQQSGNNFRLRDGLQKRYVVPDAKHVYSAIPFHDLHRLVRSERKTSKGTKRSIHSPSAIAFGEKSQNEYD
jgi:hypothetical protein